MRAPVYLDHHATTPLDERVLEAMLPYLRDRFGNAASREHSFGWIAEKAVDRARRQVAELAGCAAREVVFTSGATEAINLALKGAVSANADRGRHIITVATEHRATLDVCRGLERGGARVTVLPVDGEGLLDPAAVAAAIAEDTVMVSVMAANNEIGVLQPVDEFARLCRERGVLFHCDAAQAYGKTSLDFESSGFDLMSLSAHKIYGPKGVGALIVRKRPRIRIAAQMEGGGHEGGLRSGTLNVPAIVGMGAAAEICGAEMADESRRTAALRDRLLAELQEAGGVHVNGSMVRRLPNNLNVWFEGIDSEALLVSVPDVAISTGSACTSASVEPSHVLVALGRTAEEAHAAVRFGIGRQTTEADIDYAAGRIVTEVVRLRKVRV